MLEILVVNRPSNVAAHYVSRSISARLLEPLHYLGDAGTVRFTMSFPEERLTYPLASWALFNKAMDASSLALAKKLKSEGVRLLYDIDDHILAYPSYSGAKPTDENLRIIRSFLEISDVVTGANQHILNYYSKLRPDIQLLPNGIYIERYKPEHESPRPDNGVIKIGIVNADFLKIVNFKSDWGAAIEDVRKRYENLEFTYYGDFPPETLGLEHWKWLGSANFEDYRRSLFNGLFDIALVPLGGGEDEESYQFNLCKNPFKFMEFGAAGIAGIYSDVPVYRDIVDDKKTGILANNTKSDWVTALSSLIENADLRARLAKNARNQVYEKSHIKTAAAVLESILNNHSSASSTKALQAETYN